MSKSTQQLLEESIAEGKDFQIEVLKESVALLKSWVAELRQEKEARFGEWTTLAELRPGAVFETEYGTRGVKVARTDGNNSYIHLGSGAEVIESVNGAHVLKVREIQVP